MPALSQITESYLGWTGAFPVPEDYRSKSLVLETFGGSFEGGLIEPSHAMREMTQCLQHIRRINRITLSLDLLNRAVPLDEEEKSDNFDSWCG
jgi:hypothetical protein